MGAMTAGFPACRPPDLQRHQLRAALPQAPVLHCGARPENATRLLKVTEIRYCPFAGHTVGHPTRLTGSIDDIVDDAVRLAALPGVHELDLLTYRFAGDVEELTQRVVAPSACR